MPYLHIAECRTLAISCEDPMCNTKATLQNTVCYRCCDTHCLVRSCGNDADAAEE